MVTSIGYISPMAAFTLPWQRWAAVTECKACRAQSIYYLALCRKLLPTLDLVGEECFSRQDWLPRVFWEVGGDGTVFRERIRRAARYKARSIELCIHLSALFWNILCSHYVLSSQWVVVAPGTVPRVLRWHQKNPHNKPYWNNPFFH